VKAHSTFIIAYWPDCSTWK